MYLEIIYSFPKHLQEGFVFILLACQKLYLVPVFLWAFSAFFQNKPLT